MQVQVQEQASYPADRIRETETPDGIVLLDPLHGRTFPLDQVGSRIWKMLKQHRPLDEITDALVNEFQVSPERVNQDILEFVSALQREHLLSSTDIAGGNRWFGSLTAKLPIWLKSLRRPKKPAHRTKAIGEN
ncbi:MAG: Coenzyme synthesis protein (PqqD) [Candidatus Sulfotelmatobacter sp.]|nr:Coenzyme synthesis protein (PqqD) [Candidatus Sulfotelmatobacter sp.]